MSERVSMSELSHPILLVSLPTPEDRSRSVSPNSTSSSSRELRGIRLFRAIGRRLSRRKRNYEYDSTDSEPSSSSEGHSDSSGNNSPDCNSSKENSDSAICKVLNTLNLTPSDRRSSDSNSDISSSSSSRKKSSGSATPKKILRQPVSYTYVRGLSGLPTIRVPRNSCCAQNCGRCHTPGCNR